MPTEEQIRWVNQVLGVNIPEMVEIPELELDEADLGEPVELPENALPIDLDENSSESSKPTDEEILEVLKQEVERVKKSLSASKAMKPAFLAAKLDYAKSVVSSTTERLTTLSISTPQKNSVDASVAELSALMVSARSEQLESSLGKLTRAAEKFTEQWQSLQKKFDKLGPTASKEARAELCKHASEELVEVSRDVSDWSGQINEAKSLIGDKMNDFQKQLKLLTDAEANIDQIVGLCLPKLTSQIAKPGQKPPSTGKDGSDDMHIENTDKGALKALKECDMSWVNAKAKYGPYKDEMQKLADFRKRQVDGWLEENLKEWNMSEGAGVGWVAVGSTDPTSDYDISLNKHGEKDGTLRMDFELVQDFNGWFRKAFGGEGGTVFDTNLYASAPTMIDENDIPDAKSIHDVASLMKMRRYMTAGEFETFRVETVEACGDNFDKATEINKQFLKANDNYLIIIATSMESAKKTLEHRVKQHKKEGLTEAEKEMQMFERAGLEDVNDWLNRGSQVTGIEAMELIDEGEECLHTLERLTKDSSLESTNEEYAQRIGDMRSQELVVKTLQDLIAELGKSDTKSSAIEALKSAGSKLEKIQRGTDSSGKPLYYESNAIIKAIGQLDGAEDTEVPAVLESALESLGKEVGTRLDQLGSTKVIAKFFANEAYQSDGPFAHIVTATQAAEADAQSELAKDISEEIRAKAKDLPTQLAIVAAGGIEKYYLLGPEEQNELIAKEKKKVDLAVSELKKKRRDEIPAEQCLQSFNEQLGDFLKDLEHYGEEDPGKAMVQSSKYLERLIDAIGLLVEKGVFAGAKELSKELEIQLGLQSKIKNELIAARKGNLIMISKEDEKEPVDQQEQRRAYACQFMKEHLGVNSIAALGKKYTMLGVKVNAAARNALAKG